MQRYFVDSLNLEGFIMPKDDIHHIKKVMRQKNGDQIICLHDCQTYLCEIIDIETGEVKPVKQLDENNELPVKVNLIYALPKKDKFEWVLQKACELGVDTIIPLYSKRCVVKTNEKEFSKKYDRFNKILKEAAEQSYRNKIPELKPLITLSQVSNYLGDCNLVAYEENAKSGEIGVLKSELNSLHPGNTITIVVGCEGGFDQSEIDTMMAVGFKPCSLGKRILRSETAPLYFLSAISYAIELK